MSSHRLLPATPFPVRPIHRHESKTIGLTKACDYGYPSLDRISPVADTDFRELHDGCHTGLLRVYKEAA